MKDQMDTLCQVLRNKGYEFERMEGTGEVDDFVVVNHNRLSNYVLRQIAVLGYEVRQNVEGNYVIAWPIV